MSLYIPMETTDVELVSTFLARLYGSTESQRRRWSHCKVLRHRFLCDGQGAVRQDILYADRSCVLVGCFGLNGPLWQYFSLYRAASQRENGSCCIGLLEKKKISSQRQKIISFDRKDRQ